MKCKTTFTRGDKPPAGTNAVFFDLDGTLVDSAPDIRACLFDALFEHNVKADGMSERFRIGPPLDMMIRTMVPGLSEERLISVMASFRRRYDQSDYLLTVPYEGVEPILSELASLGIPLYVATNKPFFASTRIIKKMGWSFFEAILSPDAFGGERLKKVQLLQRIACERGYCSRRCLMVGDLPEDVDAAREAGFGSVAVTWGYGDVEVLSRCAADWLVSEPAEISMIGRGVSDG
jgi:phosphoglycolate phosphatase-like HAD superfamily hydrolase